MVINLLNNYTPLIYLKIIAKKNANYSQQPPINASNEYRGTKSTALHHSTFRRN